jgi:hypothetical protein
MLGFPLVRDPKFQDRVVRRDALPAGHSSRLERLSLMACCLPSPHAFITSDVIAAVFNRAHIGC